MWTKGKKKKGRELKLWAELVKEYVTSEGRSADCPISFHVVSEQSVADLPHRAVCRRSPVPTPEAYYAPYIGTLISGDRCL